MGKGSAMENRWEGLCWVGKRGEDKTLGELEFAFGAISDMHRADARLPERAVSLERNKGD